MRTICRSKIAKMGEVVSDGHGFFYVDLELEDGTVGYYPNTEEFLEKLKVGAEVEYIDTKEFAGRTKINGLILKEKKVKMSKVITLVTTATPLLKGENGSYYKELTTEDGITAIHFSKELAEVESIIQGSLISYSDIKTVKGKDVFVGIEKLKRYSSEDRRQLSIMRQSSIKAAIDCFSIASPKGRWITKDGELDIDACYEDILKLSERFIQYVSVE